MDPTDPRTAIYVGPPPPLNPDYIPDHDFLDRQRYAGVAGQTNMPIVIAVILSVFLFCLFVGFYLSPFCLHADKSPRPIDQEDAYFTDEHSRQRFPHIPLPFRSNGNDADPAKNTRKNSYSFFRDVAHPPPAYTPRQNSSQLSGDDTSFLPRYTFHGRTSKSRFWSMPNILNLKRTPSILAISKPIPHPEGPLPGPDILPEHEAVTHEASASDTTFVRAGVAPRSVSNSMLSPPTLNLPAPSEAHVYNRDSVPVSTTDKVDKSSRFLSAGRLSVPFGRLFKGDVSLGSVSVASSKIGLAF